jgi:hypothetical protein
MLLPSGAAPCEGVMPAMEGVELEGVGWNE